MMVFYQKKPFFWTVTLLLALLISLNGLVIADSSIDTPKEGLYADKITVIMSGDSPAKAQAEGNARLIYNNWQIEADSIDYDLQTSNISIFGNVLFFDGNYRVEAGEMTGNLDEKVFTMQKKVKLTGEDLQLISSSLSCSGNELVFQGNSSIIYKDIEAEAKTITYNLDEQTALLEGNVRGTRNGYKLTGEKLLIDLSTEKIILSNKAQILFEDQGEE